MKPILLICSEYYKPASKAGGIIEAAFNLAKGMSTVMDVYVISSDRDIHDNMPYSNIKFDTWLEIEPSIRVMYVKSDFLNFYRIYRTVKLLEPDSIFINGIFSVKYSIFPILLKYFKLINVKVVLSPRGMLKETALQYKKVKKNIFLSFLNVLSIHKCLYFHATDINEVHEINKVFGNDVNVKQIFDIALRDNQEFCPLNKNSKELNCFFAGRIHPIKNLHFFLKLLNKIESQYKIIFTIAGPIEDPIYWQDCKEIIKKFKNNIIVNYIGNISNEQIISTILSNHLIVNTSQGENFGYSIVESLQTYRPVLISDNTPWQNLISYNGGWSISLSRPDLFVDALMASINWNQNQFDMHCLGAKAYIDKNLNVSKLINDYIELLDKKEI